MASAVATTHPFIDQTERFCCAMVHLVALRRREPAAGRSKARRSWEAERAEAAHAAFEAIFEDLPEEANGIRKSLLMKILVFGENAVTAGMAYQEMGAPDISS